MSGVNEEIARVFFEDAGFLVQQPRKYQVAARPKRPEEEIDLLLFRPGAVAQDLPEHLAWTPTDLQHVSRGIVRVLGWHTDRFSPAMLETKPEIFRFAGSDSVRRIETRFGPGPIAKILCLPGLSHSDDLKQRSLGLLRDRGIDGVLTFPTMLLELVRRIEVSKNYEKSDLLQMLRILKNYDLIRSPQMEFFRERRR